MGTNKADLRLNIGANREVSTDLIKKDLAKIMSELNKTNNRSLIKVGLDTAWIESHFQRQLQSILNKTELKTKVKVDTVSTSPKSPSVNSKATLSPANDSIVFDAKKLQKQLDTGNAALQEFYYGSKNITKKMQADFEALGNYDISKRFDDKGKLESFTVSVNKANGEIEKYKYNIAKISTGKSTQAGWVFDSSSLKDTAKGNALIVKSNELYKEKINLLSEINKQEVQLLNTEKGEHYNHLKNGITLRKEELSAVNSQIAKIDQLVENKKKESAVTKQELKNLQQTSLARSKQAKTQSMNTKNLDVATKKVKSLELTWNKLKSQNLGRLDSTLSSSLSPVGNQVSKLSSSLVELQNKFKTTKMSAIDQKTEIEKFKHQINLAEKSVSNFSKAQSNTKSNNDLAIGLKNLQRSAEDYLRINDKLNGTTLGAEFSQFIDKLARPIGQDGAFKSIKDAQLQYKNLRQVIRDTGLEGQTAGSKIRAAFGKFGGWALITGSLMKIKHEFKEMLNVVKEIDAAMVEVKKVTNETSQAYSKFLTNSATQAKDTNATIADTIRATANFAKAGYNLTDASVLAESALIYKSVGDGIESIDESATSIISTMKAFGIESSSSMKIVDKFNEVSNRFAVTSKDIGYAMSASGAALSSAGNDIDESIAMFTAMNEIIQDESKTATALKSFTVRSRNTAGALREMGEDADGAAESITALQQKVKETSGVDIMIDDETFKSSYQIVSELSEVWEDLNDIQQSTVTRLLAGTHQASTFSALIKNFDTARESLEVSRGAAGSAREELETVKDSIGGALTEMRSTFEVFAQQAIDDELYKNVIQSGTKLIEIFSRLIDVFGSLGSAPLWIFGLSRGLNLVNKSGGGLSKIFSPLRLADKDATNLSGKLTLFGKKISIIREELKGATTVGQKFSAIFGGSSSGQKSIIKNVEIDKIKKYVTELGKGTNNQEAFNIALSDANKETKAYAMQNQGLIIDVDELAQKQHALANATKGSTVAQYALNAAASIMSAGLSLAISVLISKMISLIGEQKRAREEARKLASVNADKANEEYKNINNLIKEYKELVSVSELTEENKERLISIQDELVDSFKKESEGIDLVNGKYTEQLAILREISDAALEETIHANIADLNTARENLIYHSGMISDSIFKQKAFTLDETFQKLLQSNLSKEINPSSRDYYQIGKTLRTNASGNLAILGDYDKRDIIEDLEQIKMWLLETGNETSRLFTDVENFSNELKKSIDEYDKSVSKYSTSLFAQYISGDGKEISKVTKESYKIWHDELIALANGDKDIEKALTEMSTEQFPAFEYRIQIAKTVEDVEYAFDSLKKAQESNNESMQRQALGVKTIAELLEDEAISLKTVNDLLKQKNLDDGEQNALLEKQAELLSKAEGSISDLNSQMQLLQEGNTLSASQILELIKTYPQLADQIEKVENGYILEASALETIRDLEIEAAITAREQQASRTLSILKETASRLGIYEEEINAIKDLTTAQQVLSNVNKDMSKSPVINSMADAEIYRTTSKKKSKVQELLEQYINEKAPIDLFENDIYKNIGLSDDSKSTGSNAVVDAFEKSKRELDNLRKMDVIDDWKYYIELEKLNETYYKGKEEFIDEYYQHAQDVYTSLKDLRIGLLEDEKKKIQEVNKEEERKLDLKKAYENYVNALSEKTNRVWYHDRGFVDEVDKTKVEQTSSELRSKITDYKTSLIDKAIDDIKDVGNAPNVNYTNPLTGQLIAPSYLKPLSQGELEGLFSISQTLSGIENNIQRVADIPKLGSISSNKQDVSLSINIENIVANNPEELMNQIKNITQGEIYQLLDGTLLQSENR